MKRILALLLLVIMVAPMPGCDSVTGNSFDINTIKSYTDIPNISKDEIAAIEQLKTEYDAFTYGSNVTIEAFLQEDGTYAGFSIEVCKLLTELFDIEFVPKAYNEWTELKSDIDNCLTDFSGEFTHTSERMQIYKMTKPIAGRGFNAYYLSSSPDIVTESDMNGLKLGFTNGAVGVELIVKLYPDIDFEAVVVPSFSDVVDMLYSGEIDAYVSDDVLDTMFEDYPGVRSKKVFQFVYAPVSITTMNADFEPIISAINKYLDAGGMQTMFELYRQGSYEYKKHNLYQSFTAEERAYLEDLKRRNAMVNVALQHDAYPASFYNPVEGRYDGAAYDILQEVGALTGINFNSDSMPIEKPLSDILAKLKSGEVSMMPQLLYSESRKNDYIWSGVSYITTNYAMLSKVDYPNLQPFQVYYTNVGTVNKSVHEEMFKEFFPGHDRHFVYHTGDEGFDALERGEIDLLMLSETMLLVQTNYREKLGYKVNLAFNKTLNTLYGFNKDEVILRDIFDKALEQVDVRGIEKRWLSRTFDYQSKMLRDSIPYIVVFVVSLLAALFVVFIFYIKNKRLSKNLEATVNRRTRELEEKTVTLSTIYNSIPDLVFCKDVNSVYTSCNPSFEEFAGMPETELVGKSDIDIFQIDDTMAKSFREVDQKVLRSQKVEEIEELITYPDGTQKLMETLKAPLIQSNEVIGMMGISRDITARKKAETDLGKRLEQQRLMAALSQNFIAGGDIDEQIAESLRLIGEFMGISRVILMKFDEQAVCYINEWVNAEQKVASKLGTVMPLAETDITLMNAMSQRTITYITLDDIGREDFINRYKPGDVTNFMMLPVFVDGKIWGILDFVQCNEYTPWTPSDINLGEMVAGVLSGAMNRQSIEDKLVDAKELAEQNSKAKSDFLSRMSHEMRTPMNAIIGMTSIGRSAEELEQKDYCLGKIETASTHLLGVINDVLDISKIEAGKFELSLTDFNIEKMLIRITNVVNFRMEEKGQRFTVKVDSDVPQNIMADEQRLSQVITNLLGNAVKFTPDSGSIALSVRKIADENGVYTIQFEVSDTGIGISEEQQGKLFTSFEQLDGSVSRKYGGTGLGLAISKHIVEMMNGEIWVESKPGEGSRFVINVRAPKGQCRDDAPDDVKWSNLRILAVCDDENVREFFDGYATSLNIGFTVATTEADVYEMTESGGAYDIYFIDAKAENADVVMLSKWIKSNCINSAVVILSSAAEWSQIESDARSSGVDKVVTKPLFASVITECIQQCADSHQSETASIGTNNDKRDNFEGKRLLLAEDVDINREIIIALLEHTGLQIDCAEDGGVAYQMFKEKPDYDMIFMDIQMPEVDGYTSTRMIRALPDPRALTVPIVAMTANVFREDIEQCLAAGMNAHIGKPIDIEDVMAKLREYL